MRQFQSAVALSLFLCAVVYAQQFAVASIKPSSSSDPRTLVQVLPGGGLRTSGATLKFLISMAYLVRGFQILDGPGWISKDRFDVIATPERSGNASNDPPDPTKVTAAQLEHMQNDMRPRLAALLADRCKLQLRHDTREMAVFELAVAKSGSRLRTVGGNFGGFHVSKNRFGAEGATIEMLATALGNELDRPVLDRTGLRGSFTFTLSWTGLDSADGPAIKSDQSGPSIFTAVREQLGLELKSGKSPAEVLVIDHVEKPSAN